MSVIENKQLRIGTFNHELITALKETRRLRLKGSGERVSTIDRALTYLLEFWLNSGDIQQKLFIINEEMPFPVPGYNIAYDKPVPGNKPSWISLDDFRDDDEIDKCLKAIPARIIPAEFGEDTPAPVISEPPADELFATDPVLVQNSAQAENSASADISKGTKEKQMKELLEKDIPELYEISDDTDVWFDDTDGRKMTPEEELECSQMVQLLRMPKAPEPVKIPPTPEPPEFVTEPSHGVIRRRK